MTPASRKLYRAVRTAIRPVCLGTTWNHAYERKKVGPGSVYFQQFDNGSTLVRITTTGTPARTLVQGILGVTTARDCKGYHTWVLR